MRVIHHWLASQELLHNLLKAHMLAISEAKPRQSRTRPVHIRDTSIPMGQVKATWKRLTAKWKMRLSPTDNANYEKKEQKIIKRQISEKKKIQVCWGQG